MDPAFEGEAKRRGLSKETLALLKKEGLVSRQTFLKMDSSRISQIGIEDEQKKILQNWKLERKECIDLHPMFKSLALRRGINNDTLRRMKIHGIVNMGSLQSYDRKSFDEMDITPEQSETLTSWIKSETLETPDYAQTESMDKSQTPGCAAAGRVDMSQIHKPPKKPPRKRIAPFEYLTKKIRSLFVTDSGHPTGSVGTKLSDEADNTDSTELIDDDESKDETFPQETYIEKVNLTSFHVVVICISTRFLKTDHWLAMICKENEIPFYFVRTKVDIDIANCKEDNPYNFDEAYVLDWLRDDVHKQLGSYFPKDNIYLVSTKIPYQLKWDMPRLMKDMIDRISKQCQTAMKLAITAVSTEIIAMKYFVLKERIPLVCGKAMSSDDMYKTLNDEVQLYRSKLGLTDENYKKWGIDINDLTDEFREGYEELARLDFELKERKLSFKELLEANVESKAHRFWGSFFLGFGYYIGKAIDQDKTKRNEKRKVEKILQEQSEMREMEQKISESISDFLLKILDAYKDLMLQIFEARKQNQLTL